MGLCLSVCIKDVSNWIMRTRERKCDAIELVELNSNSAIHLMFILVLFRILCILSFMKCQAEKL